MKGNCSFINFGVVLGRVGAIFIPTNKKVSEKQKEHFLNAPF